MKKKLSIMREKISFNDAVKKKEFCTVNGITLARLAVETYATYLTFTAVDKSQLILPALLITSSWIADYFDGKLARKSGVCTEFGRVFDKVLTDGIMSIDTLALIFKSVTL